VKALDVAHVPGQHHRGSVRAERTCYLGRGLPFAAFPPHPREDEPSRDFASTLEATRLIVFPLLLPVEEMAGIAVALPRFGAKSSPNALAPLDPPLVSVSSLLRFVSALLVFVMFAPASAAAKARG
jgi:hypothetical protein